MGAGVDFKKYVFAGTLGIVVLSWFFVGIPWDVYVANWVFYLSLSQGVLALLALLWLLGANGVSILFVPSAIFTLSFAPLAFFALFGLWGGQKSLFYWNEGAGHSLWQSFPLLFGRNLVSLLLYYGMAFRLLLSYLREQKKNTRSLVFLVIFFLLNQTIVSWDFGMMLFPDWHHTLFALYFVFGGLYAGLAVLMLILSFSKRAVDYPGLWQVLSKLLLTFSLIWIYLWGAQFLPTWYANIPEETRPLYLHVSGKYSLLAMLMVSFLFVVPFFVSLSKIRKTGLLKMVLILLLAGSWLERFLIVFPPIREFNNHLLPLSWVTGLTTLGFFAAFYLLFSFYTQRLKKLSSDMPHPHPAQ